MPLDRPQWVGNVARVIAGRKVAICMDVGMTYPYMGLVPLDTRQGDRIAVLQTCAVPYVLRPVDDGRFTLVGDYYIHGIMGGELVDKIEWADIEML